MSTDVTQPQDHLHFDEFIKFIFILLAKERDTHPDPELYLRSVRTATISLIVILMAGSAEIGSMGHGGDDLFNDADPNSDDDIKDFLKEVYTSYNVLKDFDNKDTGSS